MKNKLSEIWTRSLRFFAERVAGWQKPDSSRDQTFQIGLLVPGSAGSYGDQAMVFALTDHLATVFQERKIDLNVITPSNDPFEFWAGSSSVKALPQSADISLSRWGRYRSLVECARSWNHLLVLSADVMDGAYGDDAVAHRIFLARLCWKLKTEVTFVGGSYSTKLTKRSQKMLASLPRAMHLFVRDPVSLQRLKAFVPFAEESRDVAFLLRPKLTTDSGRALQHWIREQKKERIVIGLNFSIFSVRGMGWKDEDAARSLSAMIRGLLAEFSNLAFVYIPHDVRDGQKDRILGEEVLAALSGASSVEWQFLPAESNSREIKAICEELDVVITGRMHLAIAALGVKCPVVAMAYHDKFEGLFRDVELSDAVIGNGISVERAIEIAKRAILNRAANRKILERTLPSVKEKAARNLNYLVKQIQSS